MSWRRPFKSGQPGEPPPPRPQRCRRSPGTVVQQDRGRTGALALGARAGLEREVRGAGKERDCPPPRVRRRMRESTWVSLLLLLLLPAPQRGGPQDGRGSPEPEPERGPLQPFDLLYASGVAAYYSGDYEGAVRDLEAALRSHRRLRDIRTRCARHCAARRPLAPPGAGPGAELPFFRAVLERARCSRSCQSQRLGGPASRHRVSEDVRSDFQRRVPYNYLQRAYIKVLNGAEPITSVTLPRVLPGVGVGGSYCSAVHPALRSDSVLHASRYPETRWKGTDQLCSVSQSASSSLAQVGCVNKIISKVSFHTWSGCGPPRR